MSETLNRRNFFRLMVGGVAAAAAVREWPFRVYSFPSRVVDESSCVTDIAKYASPIYLDRDAIRRMIQMLSARAVKPFDGQDYWLPMRSA